MPKTAAKQGRPVVRIPVQYEIDEWYPVYNFVEDYGNGTVEVTQDFYDVFVEARDRFLACQHVLRTIIDEESA